MTLAAALLLLGVSAMHSILGELRLIRPLLAQPDFPRLLGSEQLARITLRAAWHITTLLWMGIAAVLAYLHFDGEQLEVTFLGMVSAVFAISGLVALVMSRGRHLSWVFFLPVAALAFFAIP